MIDKEQEKAIKKFMAQYVLFDIRDWVSNTEFFKGYSEEMIESIILDIATEVYVYASLNREYYRDMSVSKDDNDRGNGDADEYQNEEMYNNFNGNTDNSYNIEEEDYDEPEL